jgi:hypothetical protein
MHKSMIFAISLAACSLIVGEALAVKLTKDQVNTVCNGKPQCQKTCGLNGQATCIFSCGVNGCGGIAIYLTQANSPSNVRAVLQLVGRATR